jgi:hypothetical protein
MVLLFIGAPTPSLTTHSAPSLSPPPPPYPAETVLPLSLILTLNLFSKLYFGAGRGGTQL